MKHKRFIYINKTWLSALLFLLTLFAYNSYAQTPCPEIPAYESEQFFCSEAAWAQIGEDADYLGDLQRFPDDTEYTLTWYEDEDLNTIITNPRSELLLNGTVYYVTQTNTDGCESEALKIIVSEKD